MIMLEEGLEVMEALVTAVQCMGAVEMKIVEWSDRYGKRNKRAYQNAEVNI